MILQTVFKNTKMLFLVFLKLFLRTVFKNKNQTLVFSEHNLCFQNLIFSVFLEEKKTKHVPMLSLLFLLFRIKKVRKNCNQMGSKSMIF